MAVIWGLDLKEMQWKKFKGSYMWANTYHKRRTKFGVYQLAMVLCVVSESLGTDVISKYNDTRSAVSDSSGNRINIHGQDLVGSFSYNIFVGVYVATIFGAAFFFDLFWPERHESPAVRLAWKICSVLTIIFTLSSAIVLTIILATHRLYITAADATGRTLLSVDLGRTPLSYKQSGESIASLVLLWLGFLATIWATYLIWTCTDYIHKYGPFSTHVREERGLEKETYAKHLENGAVVHEQPPAQPSVTV